MTAAAPAGPVAAILLAAGRSTRAGKVHKLTATVAGKAIVAHAADAVLASPVRPVIVVTGHAAPAVRAALVGRDVTLVHNPRFGEGVATSIAAGIAAVPTGSAGVLVVLGDMPELVSDDIVRLVAAFDGDTICVPVADGRRGNPVLFPRAFFPALAQLTGDEGARKLIAANATQVREVPMTGAGTLTDLDTEAEIAAFRRAREGHE